MSLVIGIDVGISGTKILGIENGMRIKTPMSVKNSDDSLASLTGAFGKFVHENGIDFSAIEHVMVTGAGSEQLKAPLFDLPTTHVDEFKANGLGARFDSGLDHIIVVSMGTGTSLVRVDGDEITHIGGLGMGGGTIMGLSQLMLKTTELDQILAWSSRGNPYLANLCMSDIYGMSKDPMADSITASLFGKATMLTLTKEDMAAGIIRMVLETIGSCAVLSQSSGGFKDFVLIGGLTQLPECKRIFPLMEYLYNVNFIIPKYAPYCTALGAAMSYRVDDE